VDVGSALAQFEQAGAEADLRPALALLGGRDLELDEAELQPAVRRAVLLLAAGGDPHAGLELEGRAVTAVADELFRPDRVADVERGLAALRADAGALPAVSSALDELLHNPSLAWRAYACALLAEQLDE
jgi:hypothetical protein